MRYDGMACAQDLRTFSFPALGKCLLDQWLMRFQSLSFKKLKKIKFFLPIIEGSSRYFPISIRFALDMFCLKDIILCLTSILVQELKNTSNFWKFVNCPKAIPQMLGILIRVDVSFFVALQNRKQSSAKRRREMVRAPLHNFIP